MKRDAYGEAVKRMTSPDIEEARIGHREARAIATTVGYTIEITGQTNKDGTPYTFKVPPMPTTRNQGTSGFGYYTKRPGVARPGHFVR